MDTLSDVLRAVRLSGAVFFAVDASAPWVAETPSASTVGPYLLPGVDHVIAYHVIASGTCWGGLVDEPALKLEAGDIIVFPQGDPHVISSAPGMRGTPDLEAFRDVHKSRVPGRLVPSTRSRCGRHAPSPSRAAPTRSRRFRRRSAAFANGARTVAGTCSPNTPVGVWWTCTLRRFRRRTASGPLAVRADAGCIPRCR